MLGSRVRAPEGVQSKRLIINDYRSFCLLVLCVTDVCAMSESEGILYEETKAGTEESAFGELEISTPSAVLMEVSTGKVIYEKAADEQLPPASVTKVMTLL